MQEMFVVMIYTGVGLALPRKIQEPRVQTDGTGSRVRTKLTGLAEIFKNIFERPKARLRGQEPVDKLMLRGLQGGKLET